MNLLSELDALKLDLFPKTQAIDTTAPSGEATFGMPVGVAQSSAVGTWPSGPGMRSVRGALVVLRSDHRNFIELLAPLLQVLRAFHPDMTNDPV